MLTRNTLLKTKRFLLLAFAFLLISCLRDGGEDCQSYVRFVYDYNIGGADMISPGVDKFHLQASKVDLFIFSQSGIYLGCETAVVREGTFPKDFMMNLPYIYGHGIQLIAWSGLYDTHYQVSTMVPGQSTMQDLKLSLIAERSSCNRKLQPLWHGMLTGQDAQINYVNEINSINLIKNTNSIRLNLEIVNGDNDILNADEFDVSIFTDNAHHDHTNGIIDSHGVTYEPFLHNSDPQTGVASEFRVLRLMADREAVLRIAHNTTGDILLERDITPYLYASRLHDYESMPMQEYLDRQDEYRIVMFLGYNAQTERYTSVSLQINDWIIRLHDENITPDEN